MERWKRSIKRDREYLCGGKKEWMHVSSGLILFPSPHSLCHALSLPNNLDFLSWVSLYERGSPLLRLYALEKAPFDVVTSILSLVTRWAVRSSRRAFRQPALTQRRWGPFEATRPGFLR